MYKTILIPVVFDKAHDTGASIRAARALADDGAHLTLLHVMEAIPVFAAAEIPTAVFETSRKSSEEAMADLSRQVPGAETAIVSGHAARGILDYAEAHGADCIVIASHKPGFEDFLLGSTADRVVRHAKCAVHVIR